ncbi:FAD-dependent oxidoreductase [Patescibacteria group bacterium]|nr:FAD-dependent oxidoreductase [Patescibacteria group bacterium]MBU1473165.1 FAD-dependent oxidoreductase [Patescibacteria group bacterium]MBU2459775.1 FAD-dependent oxidoreductase [Patescibacteria group bacterium]
MNIAVIGGGITGLTAAYSLSKIGHNVTVFEKEPALGGLASGFRQPDWNWPLEKTYHHLFANDNIAFDLLDQLDLLDKLIIKRPITANLVHLPVAHNLQSQIFPFDSPLNLLQFTPLPFFDRLRTGALAVLCKTYPHNICGIPVWKLLEHLTAKNLIRCVAGSASWQTVWEPLLYGKFGGYAHSVSAAWFWARIKKRTPKLLYIEGGFQTLIDALAKGIKERGGTINTGIQLVKLDKLVKLDQFHLTFAHGKKQHLFDRVLLTVPTTIAANLIPDLAFIIGHLALNIPHLHAQTLILETKEPILKNVYWLNILDRSFPFLAVVAHTNFMDKKYYGGRHLTYFGNYLPDNHPYLKMNAKQLYTLFLPFIKKVNPNFHSSFIIHHSSFIGWNAQPVHELHYSSSAPKLATTIPNVYLSNMDSIVPWDRGINYAIELGQKAAKKILE